jgi:undecaprenyl-diphosphatase
VSAILTYPEAIILGAFQGVTELFPVSSLGHSVLIPALVGKHLDPSWNRLDATAKQSPYLAFIVGMHVATAIAMIIYFWRDWLRIVKGFFGSLGQITSPAPGTRRLEPQTTDQKLAWMIILGTIPVGIAGVLLDHAVRSVLAKPTPTAIFLALNGVLLLGGELLRRRRAGLDTQPSATVASAADGWGQGSTAQGRASHSRVPQGGTAQGGTAQGGTAQGGTAQGGTAQGGTAQGWRDQGGAPQASYRDQSRFGERGYDDQGGYGQQGGYPNQGYDQRGGFGAQGGQSGGSQGGYGDQGGYSDRGGSGYGDRGGSGYGDRGDRGHGDRGDRGYGDRGGQGGYRDQGGHGDQGGHSDRGYADRAYGDDQRGYRDQGFGGQDGFGSHPWGGDGRGAYPGANDPRANDPRRGDQSGFDDQGGWDQGGRPPGRHAQRQQPPQQNQAGGQYPGGQYPGGQHSGGQHSGGQHPARQSAHGGRALKEAETSEAIQADRRLTKLSWLSAIALGASQILALFPGFSRDGSVMVAGMVRGLSRQDAVRFSFLLSAPVIFAAGLFKAGELLGPETKGIHGPILAGMLVAGVCAYLALWFLDRLLSNPKRTLTPFAIYCLIVGIGSLLYLG